MEMCMLKLNSGIIYKKMALSRCNKCGQPQGRRNNYVYSVEPLNYPNTSTICGRNGCNNPGLIWLNEKEYEEYQNRNRIFAFSSSVTKVKVK